MSYDSNHFLFTIYNTGAYIWDIYEKYLSKGHEIKDALVKINLTGVEKDNLLYVWEHLNLQHL